MALNPQQVDEICDGMASKWQRFDLGNFGHIEVRCAECPLIFSAGIQFKGHVNISRGGITIEPEFEELCIQAAIHSLITKKEERSPDATT